MYSRSAFVEGDNCAESLKREANGYSQVLPAQSCQTVVVHSSNIASEKILLCHELYLCISPCQESSYLHLSSSFLEIVDADPIIVLS